MIRPAASVPACGYHERMSDHQQPEPDRQMPESNPQPMSLDSDAVAAAAGRIDGLAVRTPLLEFAGLNAALGCRVLLKCEQFQPMGAFKIRGAGNAVAAALERGPVRAVATHSSGNHGAALAMAAQRRRLTAHVVMPENALPSKVANVRRYGAQIHFCAPTQAAREAGLEALMAADVLAVPPYDHPDVIAGQGTAAREIMEQAEAVDILIAPVGGGGLLAGSVVALGRRPDLVLYGAEPEGAGETMASLTAGHRVTDFQPDTLADGLRATVGELTFPLIQAGVQKVLPVSEQEIVDALWFTWRHTHLLIEPSSATVIAAIRRHADRFRGRRVAAILTGGNVDFGQLPEPPDNAS